MKLLIGIILISSMISLNGQELCGTYVNDDYLELVNNKLKTTQNFEDDDLSHAKLSISLFVVSDNDTAFAEYSNTFSIALEELNKVFEPINISFIICKSTRIAESDYNSIYSYEIEKELTGLYSDVNIINVYLTHELATSTGAACGYTYLPTGTDNFNFIFIDLNCDISNTLIHEMGHFFGLLHPHESKFGSEFADGSNCETAGDRICDTYASPNLKGLVGSDCNYTGTMQDSNGDFYAPQPSNIMSYSLSKCRSAFTEGQYDWMRKNYFLFRKNLR